MGNFGPAEITEIAEISKGTQIPQIAQKFGHHRWLYVSPAEIAEIAEISKGTQIPQISQKGAITDG